MNALNKDARPQARIVVGGGIDASGNLNEVSTSRISCAVERHRQAPLPLVLSGRWSLLTETVPARTEAASMRDYALQAGVDPAQILTEEKSMETIGNAYFTYKDFISHYGWQEVEVITSAFHGPRTNYSFKKVLGKSCKVRLVEVPDASLFTPSESIRLEAREQRVTRFIKHMFDSIANGDVEAVGAMLGKLPGYSTNPIYTREDLLKITAGDADLGGSYN